MKGVLIIECKKNTRLIRLRKARNLTQKEVAMQIGKQQNTVAAYENGKRFPSITTMKKLASLFGVTVDYIFIDEIEEDEVFDNKSSDQ